MQKFLHLFNLLDRAAVYNEAEILKEKIRHQTAAFQPQSAFVPTNSHQSSHDSRHSK